MVSTRSPDLPISARLSDVHWMEKSDGFTTIHRASKSDQLAALVRAGDNLGHLWKQGLLGTANP